MKEFIEELKYNQNVNIEKGLENRVDIDYVIERLERINNETIGIDVVTYIENEKCYDTVKNNKNGILDYLNSLTDEDIEIIKNQVAEDESLKEEIDSLIGYYLYHYKTWGDK